MLIKWCLHSTPNGLPAACLRSSRKDNAGTVSLSPGIFSGEDRAQYGFTTFLFMGKALLSWE